MQIVIDIPEDEYEFCKKQWDTECLDTLIIAVKYGTPLPKGHGRLIDADKLELDDGYSNYDGYYHKYSQSQIYNAPTIIERSESE